MGAQEGTSNDPSTPSAREKSSGDSELEAEKWCSAWCSACKKTENGTGSAWRIGRRPGRAIECPGCWSMTAIKIWPPSALEADGRPILVAQEQKSDLLPVLWATGELSSGAAHAACASVGAPNAAARPRACAPARAEAVGATGGRHAESLRAAAAAAAFMQVAGCGRGRARKECGRRAVPTRGGRGGRGHRLEVVRLQSAARGMLARRLRTQLELEQRKVAAKARLSKREVEEGAKKQARRTGRGEQRQSSAEEEFKAGGSGQPGKTMAAAPVVAEEAARGQPDVETEVLGGVDTEGRWRDWMVEGRWHDWMAAVRECAAVDCTEALRRLQEAEAARASAEAAAAEAETRAERAEAERAEMIIEVEGMAGALVRQAAAIQLYQVDQQKTARKLVVVEEWEAEEDVGTQTEAVARGEEVGCQTAVLSFGQQRSVAEVATQCAGLVRRAVEAATQTAHEVAQQEVGSAEVVVGKQLHPAQAKAIERAERAADRLEQVQAETEAMAARYRADALQVTQETALRAEPQSQKTAQGQLGVAKMLGGRQARKAQVRKQAAAAGMDVLSWTAIKEQQQHMQRQELGTREAEVGEAWGMWPQGSLEERLEWAHEDWLVRRVGAAYVGETESSRRFMQAARGAGINVLDAME